MVEVVKQEKNTYSIISTKDGKEIMQIRDVPNRHVAATAAIVDMTNAMLPIKPFRVKRLTPMPPKPVKVAPTKQSSGTIRKKKKR